MKNDWLTIPDAPNYEINSALQVRNKRTGYLLKPVLRKRKYSVSKIFYLSTGGSWLARTGKALRRQAKAAVTPSDFEPILSLGGKYEINKLGVVRNSRTKKIIKHHGGRHHNVTLRHADGSQHAHSIKDLLWEAHGQNPTGMFRVIPVSVENAHGKFFFDNIHDAARFLAPKLGIKWKSAAHYMQHFRKSQIRDWTITYLNTDVDIKWNRSALGALAERQAKLDRQVGLVC